MSTIKKFDIQSTKPSIIRSPQYSVDNSSRVLNIIALASTTSLGLNSFPNLQMTTKSLKTLVSSNVEKPIEQYNQSSNQSINSYNQLSTLHSAKVHSLEQFKFGLFMFLILFMAFLFYISWIIYNGFGKELINDKSEEHSRSNGETKKKIVDINNINDKISKSSC